MTQTNPIPGNHQQTANTPTAHADATSGWQAVLASVIANILASYDLQNAQDKMITTVSNALKDLTTQMQTSLNGLNSALETDVKNGADASKISADQNAYQNTQLQYQNQMTPFTRLQDQWTQAVQDTGSSTSPAYQEAQALASIAQNMAQRA